MRTPTLIALAALALAAPAHAGIATSSGGPGPSPDTVTRQADRFAAHTDAAAWTTTCSVRGQLGDCTIDAYTDDWRPVWRLALRVQLRAGTCTAASWQTEARHVARWPISGDRCAVLDSRRAAR